MTSQVKRKFLRMGLLLPLGAGTLLVIGLVVASLQLLTSKGWSRDIAFDDGRMAMRVQYKVEPHPPTVGPVDLLVKVKNVAGYVMLVDHVHVTVNSEKVADGIEAERVGDFGITSGKESFYRTRVDLSSPGSYQVVVLVQHDESRFETTWPLEVQ